MTKVEMAIKKIRRDLNKHGLAFEDWGNETLTEKCTIRVSKSEITVNDKPTELDDVIWEVLAIEKPA